MAYKIIHYQQIELLIILSGILNQSLPTPNLFITRSNCLNIIGILFESHFFHGESVIVCLTSAMKKVSFLYQCTHLSITTLYFIDCPHLFSYSIFQLQFILSILKSFTIRNLTVIFSSKC